MVLDIKFPQEEPYSTALGRFRRRIKPYLRGVSIRRRRGGVSLAGSEEEMFSAVLLLGTDYELTRRGDTSTS